MDNTGTAPITIRPKERGMTAQGEMLDMVADSALAGSYVRHNKVDVTCSYLHQILSGKAAKKLLANPADLPDYGSVCVLPSWSWLHSRISVGRKDRGHDGRRLLLPVRVLWQPSQLVVLAEGETQKVSWTAVGLGNSGTGQTIITSGDRSIFDSSDQGQNTPPAELHLAADSRQTLIGELQRLVDQGVQAWWNLALAMDAQLDHILDRAHASISAEISGTDFKTANFDPVLDPIGLQTIKDRMTIGDDSTDTTVVGRLIEKCLEPSIFSKVEPSRFINIALDRDAKASIRKAIGDPHVGPKIRNLAREVGHTDLDLLIVEYTKRYPADRLSSRRASAALTVQPDPMAARSTYDDIDERETTRQVRSTPVFRISPNTPSRDSENLGDRPEAKVVSKFRTKSNGLRSTQTSKNEAEYTHRPDNDVAALSWPATSFLKDN